MYRRAMKRAVTNSMRLGAEGIKINLGGRLNGAEIARSEWYRVFPFTYFLDLFFSEFSKAGSILKTSPLKIHTLIPIIP
jgi:hypothetical protein